MATKKRKTKRRKAPGEGVYFEFHGSYTNKDKARAKARKKGGFFVSRKIVGMRGMRYVVLTERTPF